jgi:hypothetical protein
VDLNTASGSYATANRQRALQGGEASCAFRGGGGRCAPQYRQEAPVPFVRTALGAESAVQLTGDLINVAISTELRWGVAASSNCRTALP